MDFQEYQEKSRQTAVYPNIGAGFVYPTLGMVGEAGEVAEKIKKIFRDENGIVTNEKKIEIAKELGDVLWYIAQIATELEIKLDDIAVGNIQKLIDRMERNKLQGDGDNR
jgi:NTP pyrophosphatase (non-canonical NTP hydrolase)